MTDQPEQAPAVPCPRCGNTGPFWAMPGGWVECPECTTRWDAETGTRVRPPE